MKIENWIKKIKKEIDQKGVYRVRAETKAWDVAYEFAFSGYLENTSFALFTFHTFKLREGKNLENISQWEIDQIEESLANLAGR